MRTGTVLLSAAIHAGLAVGLISAQQSRIEKKKTISVAVTGEKKKEAKPKPPPPPPVHRAAPKTVAMLPKAETVTPVKAAPVAPVATNLTMSNEDIGPGIGLGGRAPAGAVAAKSGPAAVKVASAISEKRTQRARDEAGAAGGGESNCTEPPSEPVPVVQTEINYSLYPQAQQDGIEGVFKARIIVGTDGEVVDVQVLKGVDPAFDAAIKAALMRWRFKPAMACGKPVAGGTHKFTARFELAD